MSLQITLVMSEIISVVWGICIVVGFVFLIISLVSLPGAFKRKEDRCVITVAFLISGALVASPFLLESRSAAYAVFDKDGHLEYVIEPTKTGIVTQSRWNEHFSKGRRAILLDNLMVSSQYEINPSVVKIASNVNSNWVAKVVYIGSNSRSNLLARAELSAKYNFPGREGFGDGALLESLVRTIIRESPENEIIQVALVTYPGNKTEGCLPLSERADLYRRLTPLDAQLRMHGLQIVDVDLQKWR